MQNKAKSPKGQRRIGDILDAATDILVNEGYGSFSMRRVADRLGLRLSSIQYYFNGPGDLLCALFDRSLQRSLEKLRDAPDPENLASSVEFVLNEQLSLDYCLMFWELWPQAARDSDVNAVFNHFYAEYKSHIESVLQTTHPKLQGAARRRRATIIMGLLEGLSLFRGVEGRLDGSRRHFDADVIKAVVAIAALD